MNFTFQKYPDSTSTPDFGSKNPWGTKRASKKETELGFDGGDEGLNYRFFNQAESGYKGSDINSDNGSDDSEVSAENAFLGLENLFACRKLCKKDLGGASTLRQCIRACKGKGPKKSALKGMDAESQAKMADALAKSSSELDTPPKSNKMIWIIVGIVAVIGIAVLIYFLTRNKAVPVATV
jgi:hypothetical protein